MAMEETLIGSMNYNVLRDILVAGKAIQVNRGAEVGVLYADTSTHLLREFPKLKLFAVDPYLPYEEYKDDRSDTKMVQYEKIARERLSEFGDRAELMRMTSLEAAPLIPDGSLDFVFIDAMHTYEAVTADIKAWFPKIRKFGILAGHDFSWDGVKQAVNEFEQSSGLHGYATPALSDIWFFQKM